jgi:uncharacterized protein (DUF58 family)
VTPPSTQLRIPAHRPERTRRGRRAIPSPAGSALAPPAARQGPGPMPRALMDALELALVRRAARQLPGDGRAAGVGAGTELAQLRPYRAGDDVRHIDPAATARTGGVPHVRLHVPERALTTWLVIDISPSMAFGTALRLKADVAEGAALVLGRLAIRRGGGLGVLTFGAEGPPRLLPPRSSRPALATLRRVLAEGVARDGSAEPLALAHALTRIEKVARQSGLVAVISDFRDQHAWSAALGRLRARHAVLALEVGDPRERELPKVGRLAVVDPESGARVEVDTSSARVRRRFAELETQRRAQLALELRRLRIAHVELATDADWLLQLSRGLR